MELFSELWAELIAVLSTLVSAAPYIVGYVLLILLMMVIWSGIKRLLTPKKDYGSLKTVTFGDESAVTSNTAASVISIVLIFVLWGAFTGSKLLPGFLHAPGPFVGEGEFSYTITTPAGESCALTPTMRWAVTKIRLSLPLTANRLHRVGQLTWHSVGSRCRTRGP